MVDSRINYFNKQLASDFADRLAKATAAGGCPKCGTLNILIPKPGSEHPRQCLNCGNKFEFQDTTKETK